MRHIAIIGAGQAGATLCESLRAGGYDGRLSVWGAEAELPYQRPPLSKGYLLGEFSRDRLALRPDSFWTEKDVEMHTGTPVERIDPEARRLSHAGGEEAWDALVLATGAAPRRLPDAIGGGLDGVHTIRTLADIDALTADLRPGGRLLVVGGGYIGLEAAAVARKIGMDVTLIERTDRILCRVACAETADWIAGLHDDRGVTIRTATGLTRLEGDGHVRRAILTDGSTLDCDAVVVGIGVVPEDGLARSAGLDVDDGIAVDAFGRTSAAGIWAAGDCASLPSGTGRLRLESVGNAIDMAQVVAANILGAETPYLPTRWFWSDQYDVKIQIAGLGMGHDDVVVRDAEEGRSHWYFAGKRLLAVDALNAPRAYRVGKCLIDAARSADPIRVADATIPVKALL